ncbi:MAG: hypothetical protein ACK41T_09780 [Pseudobdellovibrio sp.]
MNQAYHTSTFKFLFLMTFFTSVAGWTYVLPLDFVIRKSISTTGRSIVSLEQDVVFKSGNESLKVHESWLVEGDKNLKVSAVGADLYRDSIRVNSLFNSKHKTQILGKNKTSTALPADFYQRLLFIRSSESFMGYLKELNIPAKIRLSRADGKVCFALGEASIEDQKYAQIWIDQDDFLIRKVRLPSGTEITLSDYVKANDDLWIAKTQKITWGGGLTATINVKSFSAKVSSAIQDFYPQNFDAPTTFSFSQSSALAQVAEDFYKRFR